MIDADRLHSVFARPSVVAPTPAADTCPHCRHRTHGPVCFNMASDNDCACKIDSRIPTAADPSDRERL